MGIPQNPVSSFPHWMLRGSTGSLEGGNGVALPQAMDAWIFENDSTLK